MSYFGRVLDHVFGSVSQQSSENLEQKSGNFGSVISAINRHLQSLNHSNDSQGHGSQNSNERNKFNEKVGRVGNNKVSLDIVELTNQIAVYDTFKIIGVSHFGTVKTNCGVYGGKWQYEVLLLSSGVMQIGWAVFNSRFGLGQGVGDTAGSYAFDGSRVRKWNISAEDYGEKWEEDDVIGCCIDLEEGCIEFYRNGRSMGVAFKDIQMGPGKVYFPAVSLQQKEGLVANFGLVPFYYPVSGYLAIQDPPHEELASANYLLDCTNRLLTLMESNAIAPDPERNDSLVISHEAMLMEVGKILVLNMIPLFATPYVVESKLIPFIHGLCETENAHAAQGHIRPSARVTSKSAPVGCNNRRVNAFLDLIWAFSEKNDLKVWTGILVSRLSAKFRHNVRPLVLEFSAQKAAILTLHCLVRHQNIRHYLMNHILFEGVKFPLFMNIKAPCFQTNALWEIEPSIVINKRAYSAAVNRIRSAMNSLEEMQVALLITMMDNTDSSLTEPSSRSIFLSKFRVLRRQFYALTRIDPLVSAGSPLLLVYPFFLRLSHVLELLWEREMEGTTPDVVPPSKFYDGSISYFDIDRLGGVLLYLLKTHYNDLEERLGVPQGIQVSQVHGNEAGARSVAESSTSTARNIPGPVDFTNLSTRIFDIFQDVVHIESWSDQHSSVSNSEDIQHIKEPVDSQNFLTEILDGLVLLYHIATRSHSPAQNVGFHESKVRDIVQSLSEIKDSIRGFHASSAAKTQPGILKSVEFSYNVLLEHLHKATAHLSTLHAMICSERHFWFFQVILNTMKSSAEDIHLFNFVPEFYLDCLVEMLKALSSEKNSNFITFEDSPDHSQFLISTVQFICDHIDDQRIRIAKAKDTLLISLLDIVTTPTLVDVLHSVPSDSQKKMVRFLLQPYENRAWANSNWILVRIWHGSPGSFVCGGRWSMYHKCKLSPRPMSYPINPLFFECDPYPSPVLQAQIQSLLVDEPDVASSFLNSVLNQLNWAFSEFIGMLQELQNVSNRQERVLVESRQLKICATCFDLTVALLRVLEMVSSLALPVFVRPDQPNSFFLLARLCQLLCQVLNRASSQDGCFHHIMTLKIPGLENVDHLPILTAVCGILLAILKEDMENFCGPSNQPVPKATEILLMEPSFQISSFTFLLAENPHLYSLHYYKEFISAEEIFMVEKMLTMLVHYHRIIVDANASSTVIDEDNLCTICFAFPISALFEPCKHHSCRACITHHLMNCKNCFFCKAPITKVVDDNGKLIFDSEQSNQLPNSGS